MHPADEVRNWTHTVWDDRLISQAKAAAMTGNWGLKVDYPFLRCEQCDMNVLKLPDQGKTVNVDGIMSAVVRHMVMTKHGYVLSGAEQNGS